MNDYELFLRYRRARINYVGPMKDYEYVLDSGGGNPVGGNLRSMPYRHFRVFSCKPNWMEGDNASCFRGGPWPCPEA